MEVELPEAPRSKFNQMVAVTVAVVAVIMTLCKVKADNIVQAMLVAQNAELDSWNHYQAKSIKQNIFEKQLESWELQLQTQSFTAAAREAVEKKAVGWRAEIARYDGEKKELKAKGEGLQAEYERLNFKDDQFDLADALLGMSIAVLAISALVESFLLFGVGALVAVCGTLMAMAGFLGWRLHPGFITLLT